MAVGTAAIEIGVDFNALRSSLNKAKGEFSVKVRQMEGVAAKAGKRMGEKLGAGLKVGLKAATVGIGALIAGGALVAKTFIEDQRESLRLAKTLKATGNAAGFTAEQLEKHAQMLQDITIFDDTEIKRVEALLASFTNITGEQFTKATKAVLDLSAAMNVDTQQAAIQLGKALSDPVRGITAMQRSGVIFTDQQKKMIKGMFEMGKVAEAQNEIFKILKVNGIDANADATAAAADQWEQFKNVAGDVMEELGRGVTSMFAMEEGTFSVVDAMKELRDAIKSIVDSGFFQSMGEVFVPILKEAAKFVALLAAGLANLAVIAKAVFTGDFADADRQIISIEQALHKVIAAIDKIGKKKKTVTKETKKEVDANADLKKAIEARINTLKRELASKKQILAESEQNLKTMERIKQTIGYIANIRTGGLEDLFGAESEALFEKQKRGLLKEADLSIKQQKEGIKQAKKDIKTIEKKLRAEGIEKAAQQQVKNQEIQIELQKDTIKAIDKVTGKGSVFANN